MHLRRGRAGDRHLRVRHDTATFSQGDSVRPRKKMVELKPPRDHGPLDLKTVHLAGLPRDNPAGLDVGVLDCEELLLRLQQEAETEDCLAHDQRG